MGWGKQASAYYVQSGRTWRSRARRWRHETCDRAGSRSGVSGRVRGVRGPVFLPGFGRDLRPRARPRLSLPGLAPRVLRVGDRPRAEGERRAGPQAQAEPREESLALGGCCQARWVSLARMLSEIVMMTIPSPKVSRPSDWAQLSRPSCPNR